ncbi:MAG: glycosyltransferase family 4 protein [Planctomycetaceae bacterium]|nr:glycosyltransferase family 4 protein [Planctomycetaceae bacterium]
MAHEIKPLWLMESPNHSGMSVANRNLAAGMVRVGSKPEIFALHDGENAADFEMTNCPVRIFPHMGSALFGGAALREAESLGVNLVHALSGDLYKRAERIAHKLGLPLLVTCNRLDEAEIRSMSSFKGQGVVAVSRAIRERIVNVAGLTQNSIRVIHNGLDLSRYPRPSFSERDVPGAWHCPVIGTLGHLSKKKGQRVFLQAVKILLERGLDAEFVILGDGPDRVMLRGLADELQVTRRVTFTPHTVSGQLNQLDLLVEPSLQEGLGMSVMQAMATGVPVVATGVGGLYDLIEDGVTGVMVPAADAEALAEAIWRLLKNTSERLEMAKQAREMIEKDFSAESVAGKLVAYYRECAEAYSGTGGNA